MSLVIALWDASIVFGPAISGMYAEIHVYIHTYIHTHVLGLSDYLYSIHNHDGLRPFMNKIEDCLTNLIIVFIRIHKSVTIILCNQNTLN